MEPVRVVDAGELRSALVVTPVLVVVVAVASFGVTPVAALAGLVLGPAVTYVKNVVVEDQYRRGAFVLLVVGLLGGLAFVGFTTELLWLLIGYNLGSAAVGLYERRVRPLASA